MTTPGGRHLVFVYGTLKRNQPNYSKMMNRDNGEAQFVGTGYTRDRYPLVIATDFNTPFLLDQEGTGHKVFGEVYLIGDKMLSFLDGLENHPTYYLRQRMPIEAFTLETGDQDVIGAAAPAGQLMTEPWTYKLPQFRAELLDLPQWESYDCWGPHGLVYVLPEHRHVGLASYRHQVKAV